MSISGVQQPTVILLDPSSGATSFGGVPESPVQMQRPVPARSAGSRSSVSVPRPVYPNSDINAQRMQRQLTKRARTDDDAAIVAALLGAGVLGGATVLAVRHATKKNRIASAGSVTAAGNLASASNIRLLDAHGNLPGHVPTDFSSVSYHERQVANDCPLHAFLAFVNGLGDRPAIRRAFGDYVHNLRGDAYDLRDRKLEADELETFANAELAKLHLDPSISDDVKNHQLPIRVLQGVVRNIHRNITPADARTQAMLAYEAAFGEGFQHDPHARPAFRIMLTDIAAFNGDGYERRPENGPEPARRHEFEPKRTHYKTLAWNSPEREQGGLWRMVDSNVLRGYAHDGSSQPDIDRIQPPVHNRPARHHDIESMLDGLESHIMREARNVPEGHQGVINVLFGELKAPVAQAAAEQPRVAAAHDFPHMIR